MVKYDCSCGLYKECICIYSGYDDNNILRLSPKACKKCNAEPWESCNNNGPCSRYKKEDMPKASTDDIVKSDVYIPYSNKSPEFQLAKAIIEKHGYKLIKNEDIQELKLALEASLKRLNTIS